MFVYRHKHNEPGMRSEFYAKYIPGSSTGPTLDSVHPFDAEDNDLERCDLFLPFNNVKDLQMHSKYTKRTAPDIVMVSQSAHRMKHIKRFLPSAKP